MRVERLGDGPIIYPGTPGATRAMGTNINGPSLIRVPDWLPDPLGRYYLYFGHHGGKYIRLAYAPELTGPWRVHRPGTLRLRQTPFPAHIASPDVHLDHERREVVMYYHGCCVDKTCGWGQPTCRATSADGLRFRSEQEFLTASYLRVFCWGGWHYGVAHRGAVFRSRDGVTGWEQRPQSLDPEGRHWAVHLRGDVAHCFYSRWGDRPERILWAPLNLTEDWLAWQLPEPQTALQPERDWEGVNEPLRESLKGAALGPVHELRDPDVFEDLDGRTYLIYSVAGESGLALAEVWF